MTHIEMQQIVLDKFAEKLQDSIDIRKNISLKFGQWFRDLVGPPPEAPQGPQEQKLEDPTGAPPPENMPPEGAQ